MSQQRTELATFAGGCFRYMVKPFEGLPGIVQIVSGYTGGHQENPTCKEVRTGITGHLEAVQITFEPDLFPYEELLEVYWQHIDPTDAGDRSATAGNRIQPRYFTIMKSKEAGRKLPGWSLRKAAALAGRS